MKIKRIRGVSLMVLVITIIVIIILAGTVILNLTKNNPIENARKASFLNDLDSFKSELLIYETNKSSSTLGEFDATLLNADETSTTYAGVIDTSKTITDIITGLSINKYVNEFEILNGQLAYKGIDTKKKVWSQESGIMIDSDQTNVVIATTEINPVKAGANVEYIVRVYSKLGIKDIGDLTGKIVVTDINGTNLATQPAITVGTIIDLTNEKQIPVTINTTGITEGDYKIKLLADAVENNANLKNQETLSINTFTIDNTAPVSPTFSTSTTEWTNQNVTVAITYPNDAVTKEYSINGTIWNNYTTDITVTANGDIYARCIDVSGNESSQSTLTISNIDKLAPEIYNLSSIGGVYYQNINTLVIDTSVDITDSISGLDILQYVWDTQNTTTPTSGWTNFQITDNLTKMGIGDYYLWIKAVDKVGNISYGKSSIFNVRDLNEPVLANGMTPIKWNGSAWVTTTSTDKTWYDYANKIWANAQTLDGSMWVWIPRYEYKMATSHTSTAQTIAVNFLKGNITTATSGYTVHPAFTFGATELSGIWVAKFEASGTTSTVTSKPSINSTRNLSIDTAFTACRNMETTYGTQYGWGTSGSGIDTHLMKNVEWGAVAYLSNSVYGKTSEIWINSDSSFLTGQSGTSVSAAATTLTYGYDNATYGVNSSTTGNIYGVYDMSGGSWECTAAYVNNANINLTTNGSSLVNAAAQYKDVYTSFGDTMDGNYSASSEKKGDAIYETSSDGGTSNSASSWYTDFSSMVYSSCPFFLRGGNYAHTTSAGLFAFFNYYGDANSTVSFRPCLLVGTSF